MKVKFLKTTCFMRLKYLAEQVADLPAADADGLIKKGLCVKVATPRKKKD
jgi:hypothetical protein